MVRQTVVRVMTLPHFEGLSLPEYETPGSAGLDLRAAIPQDAPITLRPGTRTLVETGLAIALDDGYEAQIRSRSGLAIRYGIACLNAPGTIDSDYRGEIKVILVNHGEDEFVISRGDRIAQMVVAAVSQATLTVCQNLDDTARGSGGFGSTGR
ncbi:MAG: dUTP diphosphatase [Alphaproteobacteria bacterium]|nr:dUTP diphosphatase [Alphaproteobacteria bacterium]